MNNVIFVVDGYLSNEERYLTCDKLIDQIRKVYPGIKILLINKHVLTWGLEEKVDHYFYFGEGFMLGHPPIELLEKNLYERPYTYLKTERGVFENWFPLTNVTDHVANIYNTFLISSKLAKALGYEKVFKIEYDTFFDEEEFLSIKNDIDHFTDYLFFGTRKEGEWAKPHHYLIDVHMVGYSYRCFETYEAVKNDEDWWKLCERVNYYGKWIEYIIPSIIEERRRSAYISGKDFPGKSALRFPMTKFDTINSPSEWTDSMRYIPKICRSGVPNGPDMNNQITLFYWNSYPSIDLEADCKIYDLGKDSSLIYDKKVSLTPRGNWVYDCIQVHTPLKVVVTSKFNDVTWRNTTVVQPHLIHELSPRFIHYV